MIRSEQLLKEEQDHTCEFCYYELFDDKAYPCSRCVCNQPTENMWRPKIETEPQPDDGTAFIKRHGLRVDYGDEVPYDLKPFIEW